MCMCLFMRIHPKNMRTTSARRTGRIGQAVAGPGGRGRGGTDIVAAHHVQHGATHTRHLRELTADRETAPDLGSRRPDHLKVVPNVANRSSGHFVVALTKGEGRDLRRAGSKHGVANLLVPWNKFFKLDPPFVNLKEEHRVERTKTLHYST